MSYQELSARHFCARVCTWEGLGGSHSRLGGVHSFYGGSRMGCNASEPADMGVALQTLERHKTFFSAHLAPADQLPSHILHLTEIRPSQQPPAHTG